MASKNARRKARQEHGKRGTPPLRNDAGDTLRLPPDFGWSTPPLIIHTPPGQEKHSAVLLRFAEPLLEDITGEYDDFSARISLAVFAWNYALLPAPQRRTLLNDTLPWIKRLAVTRALSTLVKRKETDFAAYQWQILAFRVIEHPDEFRVEVMIELANAA